MRTVIFFGLLTLALNANAQESGKETKAAEPETFTMEYGDSTIVMQKYFIAFLKAGPNRSQSKEEAEEIQKKHLAHLTRIYEQGKTSITGPFASDGEIRGIVIFNTSTMEEAKKLANEDPAVKAGRLVVEILPWWAMKGATLK